MLKLKTSSLELVNRFDGIILFNNFSDDDLGSIIVNELSKVRKKLKTKNIKIRFKPSVKKEILKRTIAENLGGRPVRRIIQNEIEVCLSKFIIMNECSNLVVEFKGDQFICNEFKESNKT